MVLREPRNHVSYCYFCAIDVTGINRNNRKILKYPDLESARRLVAHSDECPVPVYAMISEDSDNGSTASQESQEDEKADLAMILHILFPKMSLMIFFVILICQSPQLSFWHSD